MSLLINWRASILKHIIQTRKGMENQQAQQSLTTVMLEGGSLQNRRGHMCKMVKKYFAGRSFLFMTPINSLNLMQINISMFTSLTDTDNPLICNYIHQLCNMTKIIQFEIISKTQFSRFPIFAVGVIKVGSCLNT